MKQHSFNLPSQNGAFFLYRWMTSDDGLHETLATFRAEIQRSGLIMDDNGWYRCFELDDVDNIIVDMRGLWWFLTYSIPEVHFKHRPGESFAVAWRHLCKCSDLSWRKLVTKNDSRKAEFHCKNPFVSHLETWKLILQASSVCQVQLQSLDSQRQAWTCRTSNMLIIVDDVSMTFHQHLITW